MLSTKKFKRDHFEIFDNMADLIRVKDINNKIIYTNNDALDNIEINSNKPWDVVLSSNLDSIQTEETIGEKNYSIKSSPVYNDSGDLVASVEVFRDVTREKELEQALREASAEMERDLFFAKNIQRQILPKKGTYGNLNIDFKYQPSKYLSGDLFDIFEIDDDHIGIYIVDVSGHGIAASMLTVFIRQTMYAIAPTTTSPSVTLNKLQKKFQELDLDPGRYFTMFYGVYSMSKREFKYSNAGHNSIPFLFNKESITLLVDYGLPILSFDLTTDYEDKKVKLMPGDSILMYTDGLIEAKNELGEEFGEDRVKYAILNTKGKLLEEIEEKHSNFIHVEQQDDIAMILINVN